MINIGIILGSTRPNRVGGQVADWVNSVAASRTDAAFTLIDLADQGLPHLDEPNSPMFRQYQHDHTKAWSKIIDELDGFVFVTAEYNHGIPGGLKDGMDYLFHEWSNKAVGIVSYGIYGGMGAAYQLRHICGQLGMADVARVVSLNLRFEFENYSVFRPTEAHVAELNLVLDQVVSWSAALAPLRSQATSSVAG